MIPGSGKYIIQPISIVDVCRVINVALDAKNFSKKTVDLVGPKKISFKKFLENSAKPNVVLENIVVSSDCGSVDFLSTEKLGDHCSRNIKYSNENTSIWNNLSEKLW